MRAVMALTTVPGVAGEAEKADRELVQEAQAGSRQAFEMLVRRHHERAFRAAFRVLRDPDHAEEVVQEALIKAYKGLERFESRSSFYTWLYRITVNLALDRRRSELRAPRVEWDDGVAAQVEARAVQPSTGDPELASQRRQVREIIAQGIHQLPEGQQEVLLLREVEGLSYEEIATSVGISKGTVMSRLHYARKKMIVFLERRGVRPEDAG